MLSSSSDKEPLKAIYCHENVADATDGALGYYMGITKLPSLGDVRTHRVATIPNQVVVAVCLVHTCMPMQGMLILLHSCPSRKYTYRKLINFRYC